MREVVLGALVGIQVLHVLGAQSEGGRGDARGQIQAFGYFAPDLLVDHLDEPAASNHQVVELVEVQNLLSHYWDAIDGLVSIGHELEEVVEELFALWVIAELVELLELLLEGVTFVGLDRVHLLVGQMLLLLLVLLLVKAAQTEMMLRVTQIVVVVVD